MCALKTERVSKTMWDFKGMQDCECECAWEEKVCAREDRRGVWVWNGKCEYEMVNVHMWVVSVHVSSKCEREWEVCLRDCECMGDDEYEMLSLPDIMKPHVYEHSCMSLWIRHTFEILIVKINKWNQNIVNQISKIRKTNFLLFPYKPQTSPILNLKIT